MANIARVRVELRDKRSGSFDEQQRAFRSMLLEFRKRRSDAGIDHDIKRYEFYESKGEKRRRKKRESLLKSKQETILAAIERGESPKNASKYLKKGKKKKDHRPIGQNTNTYYN